MFNSDQNTANPDLADRFNICYLPDDDTFTHHLAASNRDKIHLHQILDTTKLLIELPKFNDSQKLKIAKLTEAFKDYEFPVVTIRERSNKEVCSIFQRINSSGTALSSLELLTAWTWSDSFDLRREIEDLLDVLADKGYEKIDQALLMRMLASITCNSINEEDLVDVDPALLVNGMITLKSALSSTVDFLEGQLKIRNVVFLTYPIMFIPIVNFYAGIEKPTAIQLGQLRKWFWQCSLTLRYKAGTNRLVLEDLAKFKLVVKGDCPFDNTTSTIKSEIFSSTWRINATAAKAALCLMAQFRPKSFLTGSEVDLGTVLSAYNARQFHHIYPKGFLSKHGLSFHEANIVANICFLSAHENNSISDKDPKEYFKNIPQNQAKEIFKSALIPYKAQSGELDFSEFITLRKEVLLEAGTKLMKDGIL